MNLESALYFYTAHSESIIQWLFLTILLLAGFLIFGKVFGKREELSAIGGLPTNSVEIESFLKKILDQTAKLEAVSLEKISPGNLLEVESQVLSLKKDLASREAELVAAKQSGDSKAPAEAAALKKRIGELESKLAEYEILEDDIADLSLYKEENARLRSELEAIKGGGEASAPAAAKLQSLNISPGDDIVAEFAEAVHQESPVAAPEIASAELKETDDPMADFENAVQFKKKVQNETRVPAAAPLPKPPPRAASEGDDLFAEFAMTPTEMTDEEAELDTDKMMEEMAALVSEDGDGGNALEDGIDTDKMVDEATRFGKS